MLPDFCCQRGGHRAVIADGAATRPSEPEAACGPSNGGSFSRPPALQFPPTALHSCTAPAFDVAANLPQHGDQALDRVGATERAAQLVRQAQPDHGEHFIEPFEDRSRDARSIVIEPPRQVLKNTLGLLGGRAVPSLTYHLLDGSVQRWVEP